MTISDFLKATELAKQNKEIRVSTRFHIFYEGSITEVELLDYFISKFDEIPDIYNYVRLTLHTSATQSICELKRILDKSEYVSIDGMKTINILDNDYILFLLDFDVFHDYRNGSSSGNAKRVKAMKEMFNLNIKQIISEYENLKFYILGSYPSIEYAICLGCDSKLSGRYLSSNIKLDSIEYLSSVAEKRFGTKKKSFKNELYKTNKFNADLLIENAKIDRKSKLIRNDVIDFMNDLQGKGVDKYVNNKDKPFTFIDGLIFLIDQVIK